MVGVAKGQWIHKVVLRRITLQCSRGIVVMMAWWMQRTSTLSTPSVGPVIVEYTWILYPQNIHYTNGKRILKYGLNRTVSLEAIRILREDTI